MKLSECKRCGLHKNRKQVVLPLRIGEYPRVMFIGEAPGEQEDIQGEPFVDSGKRSAGYWHWKIADKLGVTQNCIVTNVCKCRPVRLDQLGEILGNGKPTEFQVKKCDMWLEKELQQTGCRLIILYGEYAIRAVLDLSPPIYRYVGKFYEKKGLRAKIFAMYHPASICYNSKEKLPQFKKHIKLANQFLNS